MLCATYKLDHRFVLVTVGTGGVLSMLIFETVAEAELPATSVQLPLTDCPANSVVNTVFAGGLPGARPERLSKQKKLTVTLVLFQPFWMGAGVREPLIDGAPALQAPHRLPKPQVRLATGCLRGEVRRGVRFIHFLYPMVRA